jgi:hypothetical protein
MVLPVSSTICLHILPDVRRTRRVRQPSISEVNMAQAALATKHCYAWKTDPAIDADLRPMFGKARIGFNAYSVRHRNYSEAMFELMMSGGRNFTAPRR